MAQPVTTRTDLSPDEWRGLAGTRLAPSRWLDVTQEMIDTFAELTGDRQWIHTDPDRARSSPFGGTIAHGLLTLSLLGELAGAALPGMSGQRMGLNYGYDRVRFLSPVPTGSRIRGHFEITAVEERAPGELTVRVAVEIEIEGHAKPALAADWIFRRYV